MTASSIRPFTLLLAVVLAVACTPVAPDELTRRDDVVDTIHGVEVADPYRWLEDGDSDEVQAWTEAKLAAYSDYTDGLEQRAWLYDRFQHLWRFDDESVPNPCLLSERVIYRTRRAEQDKRVFNMRESIAGDGHVLIDPNTWDELDTLVSFDPSPDCKWATFSTAHAGEESRLTQIMNLDTLEVLPDTLRGWKHRRVSWLHDNSGFFYTANPLEDEVAEDEHFYWYRVYFHRLGTDAKEDELIFFDDEVKELFHSVSVSEDGRYLVLRKSKFNMDELWLKEIGNDSDSQEIASGMDFEYRVDIVDETILIHTDWNAPNYRLMVTSTEKPSRENWRELIP
ncbi:MAG: hypothetical protein GY906_27335, partial [bacterium]|nr:hypothetical protein [bacterium]